MKTKIIIVSGFLGSGKTTLIKKYLDYCSSDENIVVLENEFGEVSIDSKVLSENNLDVYEINNGCICCTLLNDFETGLSSIIEKYNPDKLIIEPSGVAKVSDIINIVDKLGLQVDKIATLVNAFTFDMNFESFGDFYKDQIKKADVLFLTRLDRLEKIRKNGFDNVMNKLRILNPNAEVLYRDDVDVKTILDSDSTIQIREVKKPSLERSFQNLESYTLKIEKEFSIDEIYNILDKLINSSKYGLVIRSKGILKTEEGFVKFDYVDGETSVDKLDDSLNTDVVVIGNYLNRVNLYNLFEMKN